MDDARIEEIFDFISGTSIELDPDPIRRGPKYLNTMVAETRNMSNRVQVFEREVAMEKLTLERKLNQLEAEYEMRVNDLLASDPRVIKKSSSKDRQAMADNILRDLKEEISDVKAQITDLGHVETVIKSKLKELKEVNRDIRLQKSLISDEIAIGAYWGDHTDSGEVVRSEDIDLDDFVPEGTPQEPEDSRDYEDVFAPSTDDDPEDLESALDALEVPTDEDGRSISPRELDYDDLLEGF